MNIENKKQIAMLLLAVGLGLVSAFLVSQYVQNNVKEQTRRLASEYKRRNAEIEKTILGQMKQMGNEFHKKLVQMEKEIVAQKKMLKNVNKQKVRNVQQVIDTKTFSLTTPTGKRAVTINIDSLKAVGGLINPGDFVDILVTLRIPEKQKDSSKKDTLNRKKKEREVNTMLFQNVQILAVGTRFSPKATKEEYDEQQRKKSVNVTLALNPQEIALLAFAEQNGALQLSLRTPTEKGVNILNVASWKVLSDFLLDKQGTNLPIDPLLPKEEESMDVLDRKDGTKKTTKKIITFKSGKKIER